MQQRICTYLFIYISIHDLPEAVNVRVWWLLTTAQYLRVLATCFKPTYRTSRQPSTVHMTEVRLVTQKRRGRRRWCRVVSLYIFSKQSSSGETNCASPLYLIDETIHKDDSEKKITHSLVIDLTTMEGSRLIKQTQLWRSTEERKRKFFSAGRKKERVTLRDSRNYEYQCYVSSIVCFPVVKVVLLLLHQYLRRELYAKYITCIRTSAAANGMSMSHLFSWSWSWSTEITRSITYSSH